MRPKLLWFVCMIIFSINSHSQNVYFMGIQLGSSVSKFNTMLSQKGFRKVNSTIDKYGEIRDYYKGYFWESDYNSIVSLFSNKNGFVNSVSVSLGTIKNKRCDYSTFKTLFSSLQSKYGTAKAAFGNEYPQKGGNKGHVVYCWLFTNGTIRIDYECLYETRSSIEISYSAYSYKKKNIPPKRNNADGDL